MCVLVAGAYYSFGSASLAAHSDFVEMDGHSDFKAVGGAAAIGSAAVAT